MERAERLVTHIHREIERVIRRVDDGVHYVDKGRVNSCHRWIKSQCFPISAGECIVIKEGPIMDL